MDPEHLAEGSSGAGQFSSAQEYEQLQSGAESNGIHRTHRMLDVYKQAFGQDLGKGEELILDVGAGDSSFADEIKSLPDHHATVMRLDYDYAKTPPPGETPAIAADAADMPLLDNSFDKIVSFWMLPHLGPEKGSRVVSEMLRVLKPEGKALLFPARPVKSIKSNLAKKHGNDLLNRLVNPSLVITKPRDFADWPEDKRQGLYRELAGYVTYGGPVFGLMRLVNAGYVKLLGQRQLDRGKPHPYWDRDDNET